MRITLCGSTKFHEEFLDWNRRLSMAGHVVYSVAFFGHNGDPLTDAGKLNLDAVHMAKIANSDAIVVLNRDDYVGESTYREIMFARAASKLVFWIDTRREMKHTSDVLRKDPRPNAKVLL